MKFSRAVGCLLLLGACEAFAPVNRFGAPVKATSSSARALGLDPHVFHDIPNQMQILQDALSTISLSDAMDVAADAGDVVDEVAKSDNGWFGFLTAPIELLLQGIHSTLVSVGLSADAWGITIIAMTLLIKLATFPLTKTQLESTNKMQVRSIYVPSRWKMVDIKYQQIVTNFALILLGAATGNQGYPDQISKQS